MLRTFASIIQFPLSGGSDSRGTLPPLFSLIRTSCIIIDLSLFNQGTPPRWLFQVIRMRLRNNPFTLETMSQPCKGNNSNWVWINTLITTKAPHTRANLHLAATVAKTTISNSTPSCRQPWLLYHTGDIKECMTLSEAKTYNPTTRLLSLYTSWPPP